MTSNENRLLPHALIAVIATLFGCSAPQLYSNNVRIDYRSSQRPAAVQVSDVKLFQRHALINERKEEQAYLAKLLADSATATFTSDLVRDVENIRAMSLAVGLSFDAGAKDLARADTETNDIAQQIALENLRSKLAQLQRDVELLKVKLSEQTAPSGTSFDQKPVPIASVAAPIISSNKELVSELNGLITSLKSQLDRVTTAPRTSSTTGSPRELFQDRQAYRQELQASINANALDALHDIGTNSLFRIQFQAMALPEGGSKSDTDNAGQTASAGGQLGLLEMSIKRPTIQEKDLQRELQALYFQWLDYATSNLNLSASGGTVRTDQGLFQLGMEQRVMSIVVMNTGKKIGEAAKVSAKPPVADVTISPYQHHFNLAEISPVRLLMGRVAARTVSDPAPPAKPAKKEETSATVETTCTFGPLASDQTEAQKHCQMLSIAYPPDFDSAEIVRLKVQNDAASLPKLEESVNAFLARAAGLTSGTDNAAFCRDEADKLSAFDFLFMKRQALLRLQRTYSWTHLKSGANDAAAAEEVARLISAVGMRLALAERASSTARKLGCTAGIWTPDTPERLVPQGFIDALFVAPAESGKAWTARGRLSVYAVTPTALVQRVSTAARAADAVQMAASLAASLPTKGIGANAGLGYMRSVTGKVDALERVPLVVGYSTAAEFDETGIGRRELEPARAGWLLGPKVVIDTEKKALALEHHLSPYELSADVSMPGWWPQVTLESRSAWGPAWDIKKGRLLTDEVNASPRRLNTVPIRHTPADMSGITLLLLGGTQNDGEAGGIGLRMPVASVTKIEPVNVSDCAKETTFVVKGNNLWRASSAYLSGVEASKIAIMPDMNGAIITFDISKLQPGAGEARLIIPTPDGEAFGEIQVQGNRSEAVACGVREPDDGSAKIAAIIPETVYACDSSQQLIVRGKHLSELNSATLGGIALKFESLSADGKLMELLLPEAIGKRGGSQTKLPLVLRMKKGTAIGSVQIERDNCSKSHVGGDDLVLISGTLDVCDGPASAVVMGKGSKRIAGARLVGSLPNFDLKAKTIRYNPTTKMSEIEFVGLPKGAISGPDQLGSPLKLVLSAPKRADVTLDVPTVCSVYAKK